MTRLQLSDLCNPAPPRQVREVHWASLPLLRLRVQHDGWSLRLLPGLPPLQRGGCGQEDPVDDFLASIFFLRYCLCSSTPLMEVIHAITYFSKSSEEGALCGCEVFAIMTTPMAAPASLAHRCRHFRRETDQRTKSDIIFFRLMGENANDCAFSPSNMSPNTVQVESPPYSSCFISMV